MAFSSLTSHFIKHNAASGDLLDVSEPAAKTILPANIEDVEELDFDEIHVVALFKNVSRPILVSEYRQICSDRRLVSSILELDQEGPQALRSVK